MMLFKYSSVFVVFATLCSIGAVNSLSDDDGLTAESLLSCSFFNSTCAYTLDNTEHVYFMVRPKGDKLGYLVSPPVTVDGDYCLSFTAKVAENSLLEVITVRNDPFAMHEVITVEDNEKRE